MINRPIYNYRWHITLAGKALDHIGAPVVPMIERVKVWIAEGKEVRVFTARVAATGLFAPESKAHDTEDFAAQQTRLIGDWCERHIGTRLSVTATKDFAMIALYDDRCVQVEFNTGRLVGG